MWNDEVDRGGVEYRVPVYSVFAWKTKSKRDDTGRDVRFARLCRIKPAWICTRFAISSNDFVRIDAWTKREYEVLSQIMPLFYGVPPAYTPNASIVCTDMMCCQTPLSSFGKLGFTGKGHTKVYVVTKLTKMAIFLEVWNISTYNKEERFVYHAQIFRKICADAKKSLHFIVIII